MNEFHPYENLGQQYFFLNAFLYASQADDSSKREPWMSRYLGPRKLELKATSFMTLEQVIQYNLPDIEIAHCRAYITQMPFRTHGTVPYGKAKQEVQLKELAIRLRDNQLIIQLNKPLESDNRHKLLTELLSKENRCLECLQKVENLLDSIAMGKNDFRVFTPLNHLIELISSFGTEFQKVLGEWDPLKVFVGKLFLSFQTLWSKHYSTFFKQYKSMSRFVEEKRGHSLQNQGNSERERNEAYEIDSVYTRLDEYLLMPFEQVEACERTLYTILTEHTPLMHPDRDNLLKAHDLVRDTLKIATLEKQASDNERILKIIQDKFQNDTLLLYMRTPLDILQAFKKYNSTTGFPQKNRLKQQMSRQREESQTSHMSDTSRHSTQTSEMFAPPPRTLIREGAFSLVHLQSAHTRHERHLILLTDLLILAKPAHHHKSGTLPLAQSNAPLSLKHLVPLQFVWTSDQLENELMVYQGVGFILGWPAENSGVNNVVAIFSSTEEMRQWFQLINEAICKSRKELLPVKVPVQLSADQPVITDVPYGTQVSHLQQKVFELMCQQPGRANLSQDQFTLTLVVKEGHHYQLVGCEHPAAIRAYYSLIYSWRKGHDTTDSGCYFMMKQLPQEPDPEKGTKKRFGFQFPFKKHPRFQINQPPHSDVPRLFRLKLDSIMPPPAYNIPQVLCGILVILYVDGPSTFGIFRVEASNRQVNELMKRIENGEEIDFEEYRVVVVANVFKRFLRAIPGCLLLSSKYTEFAATNDIKSDPERVERIKKILAKMPPANSVLAHYVFVILREITENVKHNQMCALNLGKCLGPSILQPMEGLKVYQLEMHEVVAFIIEHCDEVFGQQIPDLYRNTQANKQKVLVPVKSESPRKHLLSSRGDSNDSMDSELNRTGESCESDALATPTNEPQLPIGGTRYRRESHDSLRSRFRSEPNMQRGEKILKKNISIEVTEIKPFDSPGAQSRSTPNSPELVRTAGHLEAPPRDSQSRSTPNTPEVARANQNTRTSLDESSDEDEKPTQSKARVFVPTSDYTAVQYHKHRLGANQHPPSYPQTTQQLPMTSQTYQTPSYYKHAHNTGDYTKQPFKEYGMPRLTHVTGTYPQTLPSNRGLENNVRDKPHSSQLTRSHASYELSYPRTLPHPHPQAANQIHSSEAHQMRVRPDSVLPLSIQKSRAVIATFPIIQDAQISKLSEVRPFVDVSHV